MGQKLANYYNLKEERFTLYFNSSLIGQDIEDIHQLRVTIKELRAIWMLIEWSSPKAFRKDQHFTLIAPLFKNAGRLREAQVNFSMVRKLTPNYLRHYKNHLLDLEKESIIHLLVTMKAFDIKGFNRMNIALSKVITSLKEEDLKRDIAKLIHFKLEKANKLRIMLPNDKKLHKIRIHLKVVKEMFQIMKELEITRGLEKLRNQNITICKHLGEWHDQMVLLESLKSFNVKVLNNKELGYFEGFVKRIAIKEQSKKNLVLEKLNNYLNLHHDQALLKASQ